MCLEELCEASDRVHLRYLTTSPAPLGVARTMRRRRVTMTKLYVDENDV